LTAGLTSIDIPARLRPKYGDCMQRLLWMRIACKRRSCTEVSLLSCLADEVARAAARNKLSHFGIPSAS
jgi:hypothetical protein